MPRPVLYPGAEDLIRAKKTAKLRAQQAEQAEQAEGQNGQEGTVHLTDDDGDVESVSSAASEMRRNRGVKRKESMEVKALKATAKRRRRAEEQTSAERPTACTWCNMTDHSSKKSPLCEFHDYTLDEIIRQRFPDGFERFTISIPLETFLRENGRQYAAARQKIIEKSAFVREVITKAQFIVNHYILMYPANLSRNLFQQNFWYTVCRLVYGRLTIDEVQRRYPLLPHFREAYTALQNTMAVNLTVPLGGLTYYGQVISSACVNVATTYENYYVGNFQDIIAKYFLFLIRRRYPTINTGPVTSMIYDHVLPHLLLRETLEQFRVTPAMIDEDDVDIAEVEQIINSEMTALRNRIPMIPLTKDTLTRNPQTIVPLLRQILQRYEPIRAEWDINMRYVQNHLSLPPAILGDHEVTLKEFEDRLRRLQPRTFAPFPNPGLKWRFIKIDSENLFYFFFPMERARQLRSETRIGYITRCFCSTFNFGLFGLADPHDLQNLHQTRGKMFLNTIHTDGQTCRVSFARRKDNDPLENVKLELQDFNQQDITAFFKPVTVDPGRKDAYVSYHGKNQVRRLSTKEYYAMSGSTRRAKLEDDRKRLTNIKEIETNIPTTKTAVAMQYRLHVQYMCINIGALHRFYDFRTSLITWKNYRGRQIALDNAANILINGSKKYNSDRRQANITRKNRRKRKKINSRRNDGVPSLIANLLPRQHRSQFDTGDSTLMPLIVFGDGLTNRAQVRFHGLRTGVSGKIYKHLRAKEKQGQRNEFTYISTSMQVCNVCRGTNMRKVQTAENKPLHQILFCNECNIYWNRDVNAAKNMFSISEAIWSGEERPAEFQHQPRHQQ